MDRFAFYERTTKVFAVVMTGELKRYGNLILKRRSGRLKTPCDMARRSCGLHQEASFALAFLHSAVVEVSPREIALKRIPIFERASLRETRAPMKKVVRCVPGRIIRDW